MDMQDKVDRTNEAVTIIANAISDHYGHRIEVYTILAGLSTIAADIIMQSPQEHRKDLLEAWEESIEYVRSVVNGMH